jgi:glutathione S-transferase
VQLYYERVLRPAEKQHAPWATRVTDQMHTAFRQLDDALQRQPFDGRSAELDQALLSTAVAWHFAHSVVADVLPAADYPALQAFSAQAEALPEFKRAPHGETTYPQPG